MMSTCRTFRRILFIALTICQTSQRLLSAFFYRTYAGPDKTSIYNDLHCQPFYTPHSKFCLHASSPALCKDHHPHRSKQVLQVEPVFLLSQVNSTHLAKEGNISSMCDLWFFLKEILFMYSYSQYVYTH